MVDKPLSTPVEAPPGAPSSPQEVELQPEDQGEQGLVLNLDGSPLEEEKNLHPDQDFGNNVAEHMKEAALTAMASELMLAIDEDKRGRSSWIDIYKKGLDYLGIKDEKRSMPWEGACGTTHPMVLEAVVRYQSRALVKLFPQYGPCKIDAEIIGNNAPKVQSAIAKAERTWNRYISQKMPEFKTETDLLLFSQASIGYAAKKVYYHDKLGRVTTSFVSAESLIIPYGCPNLETCPRYTEIVKKTPQEVASLQRRKFYLPVPVNTPIQQMGEIESKKSELTGQEASATLDDSITLYEVHADLYIPEDAHGDPDGDTSPYIVTLDEGSYQILSIRRGWRQPDPLRRKRAVFVSYPFVPGDGSYAYGYIHLIGQIASSVTKVMRQLMDSGTLSNLAGGFKSKFARTTNQQPIAPGEWRDIDLSPEDLQAAFLPLPYKEPSQTLLTLMQGMIDEGKSFSSTADLDISASSQNAPVGTTLALLERQTEVSNAIQLRLYDSFSRELALLMELMKEFQPDVYTGIFGELESMVGPFGICPVGDPSSATLSQRIIQLQSVLQIAQQAPQVFNLPALFKTALTAMGVQDVDTLIPDNTPVEPSDPIQETMAVLTGKPVKAFEYQDHDAHLAVHTALLHDPYYQQQLQMNPQAPAIMGALQSHIAEHLAFQFRAQVQQQLGVQLPPLGQLPPPVEAAVSSLVVPAVQQVVQDHAATAAQQAQQQAAQDPALALQQQELQLKAKEQEMKNQQFFAKQQADKEREQEKNAIELKRIQSAEMQAQWANQTKLEESRENRRTDRVGQVIDFAHAKHQLNHESALTASEQHQANQEAALTHHRETRQQNLEHQRELAKIGLEHARGTQELANNQQESLLQHEIKTKQLAQQPTTPQE